MKKLILFFFFGAFVFIVCAQTPQPYWQVNGNAAGLDSIFLGHTNCNNLIFKTNNIERMRLRGDKSFLAIGTDQHTASLHLHYQVDSRLCIPIEGWNDMDFIGSRNLLHLSTPETGSDIRQGFLVSFSDQGEIQFKQQTRANFLLEGIGGGLTIAPDGKVGVGIFIIFISCRL